MCVCVCVYACACGVCVGGIDQYFSIDNLSKSLQWCRDVCMQYLILLMHVLVYRSKLAGLEQVQCVGHCLG